MKSTSGRPDFRHAIVYLFAAITFGLTSPGAKAVLIGTGPPSIAACCFGNETDVLLSGGSYGRTNVRTLGQTFLAPAGATSLLNFSFWLEDFNSEGSGLQLKAYLMDYSAGTTPGPVLYESTARAGSTAAVLEKYTFNIAGGQSVTAGNEYIIFMSTLDFAAGSSRNAFGTFDSATDPFLSGTGVVFLGSNHQDDPFSAITSCTTGCWSALSPYKDLAFEVEFATSRAMNVPEPGSLALIGAGFLGLRSWTRRRTRKAGTRIGAGRS